MMDKSAAYPGLASLASIGLMGAFLGGLCNDNYIASGASLVLTD